MGFTITHGGPDLLSGAIEGAGAAGQGLGLIRQGQMDDAKLAALEAEAAVEQTNAERARRAAAAVAGLFSAQKTYGDAEAQAASSGASWEDLATVTTGLGLAPAFGPPSKMGLQEGQDYPSAITERELRVAAGITDKRQLERYQEDLLAKQEDLRHGAEKAVALGALSEHERSGLLTPEEVQEFATQLEDVSGEPSEVYAEIQATARFKVQTQRAAAERHKAADRLENLKDTEWAANLQDGDKYARFSEIIEELRSDPFADYRTLAAEAEILGRGYDWYMEQTKQGAFLAGVEAAAQAQAENQEVHEETPPEGFERPGAKEARQSALSDEEKRFQLDDQSIAKVGREKSRLMRMPISKRRALRVKLEELRKKLEPQVRAGKLNEAQVMQAFQSAAGMDITLEEVRQIFGEP